MKNYVKSWLFLCMLCAGAVTGYAADSDEIIELQGDRYVIHVGRMNPDSEMTLLDVLNTCPEFLSLNGKVVDQDYGLRIDNIDIVVDAKTFLANVKACEIDRIQIVGNTSVAKAVSGTSGIIDIYYRTDVKTDGKVSLTGSTYGNGTAYADVTNRSEKLTVQAYAMGRTSYGKMYPTNVARMTDRTLAENLHLNIDWKMSQSDRLIVKAFQMFDNSKQKIFDPDLSEVHPNYNRNLALILSYSHTFSNDAILFVEAGCFYERERSDDDKTGDSYPYTFVELDTPLFTPDLWLMVGAEMDHENIWHVGMNREQYLKTDFYAQLDYTHGPWMLTFGDRFRMMNFWNRQYDAPDHSIWSHERSNHSYFVSVGYKVRRHSFQAQFARRFFVPVISDFVVDDMASTNTLRFDAGNFSTQLAHQGVLRYSYQQKNFILHSSVENTWHKHYLGTDYQKLGIRNSVYWKIGSWELTLGANFYHQHQDASDAIESDHNYVTLKLAPVVHLPYDIRLSSTLLYSSRRTMDDKNAHLFATVKADKQLGKKCNVFAEFHDITGYTKGYWIQLANLYQNRALSVGATVYPFRK